MRDELTNKLAALEFNIRCLLRATECIRNEFEKGRYLSVDHLKVFDEFYKLINTTLIFSEVKMYLKLYDILINQYEGKLENRHRKNYPGGTKTFS